MNKIKSLLALLAALVCGGALAQIDEIGLTPSMWYTFNENDTTIRNHGSFTTSDNKDVSSGEFVQVSGANYAWKMGSSVIELGGPNSGNVRPATYLARINFDGQTYANAVIWGTNGRAYNGIALVVNGNSTDGYTVKVYRHSGGNIGTEKISYTVPAEKQTGYHTYVVTVANATPSTFLYVDGVSVGSSDENWSMTQNGMTNLGQGGNGYSKAATGLIYDDFRFYTQTLTAAQVAQIAFATNPTSLNCGVISMSFDSRSDYDAQTVDTNVVTQTGIVPGVPGYAWNTQTRASGAVNETLSDVVMWSGSCAVHQGVSISYTAANCWQKTSRKDVIIRGYLDDGGSRASVTVSNIPFTKYSVYVYCGSDDDNRDRYFSPVKVNDTPYRWGVNGLEVAASADATAATRWGNSNWQYPALGQNVLRVDNVTGSSVTIKGGNNANSSRGGICAIQIVAAGEAVSGNTSVSALKAMIPAGAPAYAFELDAGATLAVDASFDIPVTINCAGSLTLKAASAPAAATYTNLDLSGVKGAIKRSWLNPTSFAFNFANNRGADLTKALEPSKWTVDASASSNANGVDLLTDGLTKITWSAGGVYDDQQSGTQTFVRGYLDDNRSGDSGIDIKITNVPFERYDVIVYATTDTENATLSYKVVNGINYTKDTNMPFAAMYGCTAWGSSRSSTTPAYGTNALRISNQTARDLTVSSIRTDGRGCIAAVQVIDTSSTFTYSGVLTTSFVKTGWKVASADDLLGYGYSGFMCGGYVDDKPRNASAHHVTKHDDGTVSFELQASNNQTKGVRVVMKVEDGEVQIKSTGAAYNGTGTKVGIKLFNDDGTVKETSGSHATTWDGNGYGVCQITASKGYRVSNASFARDQGNYSGSATWTLTLPAKGNFVNGDVVLVDRFMMGTEGGDGYNSNRPAKIKIGDTLSQTRSGATTIGDLLYLIYTFETPVPVTVGEATTVTFHAENGTQHTGNIRTRVVDYSTDLDNSCVLKISGQNQYCPLCIVSGNQAPAYNATISTATATWNTLGWQGGAIWENGDDKIATLTIAAESTLTIGSQITASILKIKGSANLTIADPQNLNAAKIDLQDYEGELILDTASNATIGGIVGGTIVKTGLAELGLNNKGTADAVSGTIVKINAGTVNLNSDDHGSRSTNATFVMNGGDLTNFGWPSFNGTLTLEYSGDTEKSIFVQKYLQGGPAIVKRGTGTLVIPAGSDAAFASITVEAGVLRFSGNAVTATKLIPGAGTLDIPSDKTVTVGSIQAGEGTVKVTGQGTLQINNASAFTGTFDIAESAEVVLANLANLDTMTPTIAEGGDKVTIPSDIGFRRTLPDWVKFAPGTTQVTVSESSIEYAQGTYTAPAGLEDYTVMVRRPGVAELVPLADVLADKTIKIAGGATSIDATFVHFADDKGNPDLHNQRGTLDYHELADTNMQYDNNPTFVNYEGEGESKVATKNTGIKMNAHPYIQGIADSWWTGTRELTLAVVGTMPSEQKTIFIHMGSSVGSGKGLMLATGEKEDEVVVAWNNFKVINEITRMSVPNAASARHVYIVTKQDNAETQKTTFTVYLDGMKWKTLEVDLFTIKGGVQVGSDFGGDIAREGTWKAANGDTGIVNAIRVYGRVISDAEIAKYSVEEEFPYHSPKGSSARTFAAGAANWVATEGTPWSNLAKDATVAVNANAALDGSSIEATLSGAAEITVNVAEAGVAYEALNVKGSGSASFVAGEGSGSIRVTGVATIGNAITVKPGSLDLSTAIVTLADDGAIAFDYTTFNANAYDKETKVKLTGEIEVADTKVTCTLPSVDDFHTVQFGYDSSIKQYVLTVGLVAVDPTNPPVIEPEDIPETWTDVPAVEGQGGRYFVENEDGELVIKTGTPANGLTSYESYVLKLDPEDETSKPVVSAEQDSSATSITIVDNITFREGKTATRKLKIGTTAESCAEVEADYNDGFTIDLPTGVDKVKFIKIEYVIQ